MASAFSGLINTFEATNTKTVYVYEAEAQWESFSYIHKCCICVMFYSQYLKVGNLCLLDLISLYSEHFVTGLLLNKLHRQCKNLKIQKTTRKEIKSTNNPILRVYI